MAQDAGEGKPKTKRPRATKRELAQRDLRLIEKLAAGVTIEEIAASEGISRNGRGSARRRSSPSAPSIGRTNSSSSRSAA